MRLRPGQSTVIRFCGTTVHQHVTNNNNKLEEETEQWRIIILEVN